MPRSIRWLLLCCALGVAPQAAAGLTQLTDLFVFGDSLSDGGNSSLRSQQFLGSPLAVFPPPPFYVDGRFSNGPVAVEYLWNLYNPGNPGGFAPSLAGGTNYAIGGATTGTANYGSVNDSVPDFLQPAYLNHGAAWQLEQFAAPSTPAFDPATSLFVVWLFPNDLFYFDATGELSGSATGAPTGATDPITNGIANIAGIIQTLAAAGAQHFLVPNLVDLGMTPGFLGDPVMSGVSAVFNANLAATLDLLDAALPIEIVQFDIAGLLADIAANPGAYGFSNATQSCLDHLADCDPASWIFWDEVHLTTAAHLFLATQFAQAVPEPGALALLALALGLFGFVGRIACRSTFRSSR